MNATLQPTFVQTVRPELADDPWIIVAAYNEAARLGATLDMLCRRYSNVVVVDDGSTDTTRQTALHYPVWILRHMLNCGQGAALQTGISFALRHDAKNVVTFDADGQHCVEDIETLMEPLRTGRADVVLGSRFLGRTEGLPLGRWLVLKLGVLFTRLFSNVRVTDTHNGLRALSRAAAGRVCIQQNRMAHASEILDQIQARGLKYCEAPVTIRYSHATLAKGQSSWNAVRIVGQLLLGRVIR
jgi:glycosyltransferase involved in cell wall biosynthesis